MAKTAVADIIIPTEFEKYAIERTAELSRFGESGIVEMAPEFDALAAGGGREVKMPFWKDLTATRQLLSDSASLKSCRAAVRSFQNGIFTSRPPPCANASNSGAISMMPDSPNRDSSAVRSIAYFSNSVGMIMSATAVFAIVYDLRL